MKSFILCISFVFVTSSYSSEVNYPDKKVNQVLFDQLKLNFNRGILVAAQRYNKQRTNTKYSISLFKKSKLKPKKEFIPVKLPKAIIKDSTLYIPTLKISFSFNNFLNHTFSINNKLVSLNCKIKNECIYKFANSLKKETSSILNIFYAYANFSITESLGINDYKLLTTLMALDDQFEDVSTLSGLFLSDEAKMNMVKNNLNKLYPSLNNLYRTCKNWEEHKSLSANLQYADLFLALKKVSELSVDDDFSSISEKKLGEEVLSYTGHENANELFNKERQWHNMLTCKSISGISHLLTDKNAAKTASISSYQNRTNGLSITGISNDKDRLRKQLKEKEQQILNETNNLADSYFLNKYGTYTKTGRKNSAMAKEINKLIQKIKSRSKYEEGFSGFSKNIESVNANLLKKVKVKASLGNMSAYMDEHRSFHKKLEILKLLSQNEEPTEQGYCKVLDETKSCLDNYYSEVIAAYNSDRLDSDTKDELEDIIGSDPNLDIKGGKVISN